MSGESDAGARRLKIMGPIARERLRLRIRWRLMAWRLRQALMRLNLTFSN